VPERYKSTACNQNPAQDYLFHDISIKYHPV